MNLFAVAGLACGISSTILALIALIFGKAKIHRILGIFNIAVAVWGFGGFIVGTATTESTALFGWKFAHLGGYFVSILFFHMVCIFCKVQRRSLFTFGYLQAIIFNWITWIPDKVIIKTRYVYNVYYNDTTFLFALAVLSYLILVIASFRELIIFLKKSRGIEHTQTLYIIFGFLIGFIGGTSTFLPEFRIDIIYPFGNFGIVIYCLIVTYAILRYRLMDIRVAVTRAGVFGVVYTLVLGIPFALGWWGKDYFSSRLGIHWWLVPTAASTVLATAGPFIYLFFQRKAENRILKEEKRIIQLLMQASSGMTTIRNFKKLLELIVRLVYKALKINNAAIYLLESNSNQYVLKAARFKYKNPISINSDGPLIQLLKQDSSPLVYEEIKIRADMEGGNHSLREIESQMKGLSASVIIPTAMQDTLLGFLILGERKSSRMYTPDLLNALGVMANQAALAIENARFYESDKENQALLYQSATLSDMGVMADSMGHQIKNHIQKMMAQAGGNAGILEELLKQGIDNEKSLQLLKRMVDVLHVIEKQGEAGGKLIESISKFSRLPKATFKEITIKEILDTANDILRFKLKFELIDYDIHIPDNLPVLYAHPILSEAFVNLIDNAYDAIREKEEELDSKSKKAGQPVSYRGRITFTAIQKGKAIEIKVKDNGIGIKEEGHSHLFLPFYTTKATSTKGTGLGLFVVKKIINNHQGSIEIDSEYMQGTTFTITLPIRQERKEAKLKKG